MELRQAPRPMNIDARGAPPVLMSAANAETKGFVLIHEMHPVFIKMIKYYGLTVPAFQVTNY